jgi:hypothetical protein
LNVHGVNDIRHTDEPLAHESSCFHVEIAIGKLKRNKSPSTDQIPAELLQAGGNTQCSDIRKLIHSIWNKEELPL